jgi:hypothetical protein
MGKDRHEMLFQKQKKNKVWGYTSSDIASSAKPWVQSPAWMRNVKTGNIG